MTSYDTIYTCPVCESEHIAEDWNESTEESFGEGILPIELADAADEEHEYACPTCGHESGKNSLLK